MSRNSKYAARYEDKRKTKRVNIAFYLDDDNEKALYEQLNKEQNKKQLILNLLNEHYFKNN